PDLEGIASRREPVIDHSCLPGPGGGPVFETGELRLEADRMLALEPQQGEFDFQGTFPIAQGEGGCNRELLVSERDVLDAEGSGWGRPARRRLEVGIEHRETVGRADPDAAQPVAEGVGELSRQAVLRVERLEERFLQGPSSGRDGEPCDTVVTKQVDPSRPVDLELVDTRFGKSRVRPLRQSLAGSGG